MIKSKLILGLSELDERTLILALNYAYRMKEYGLDITEKWTTATENTMALSRAYNKGYRDALDKVYGSNENNDYHNVYEDK